MAGRLGALSHFTVGSGRARLCRLTCGFLQLDKHAACTRDHQATRACGPCRHRRREKPAGSADVYREHAFGDSGGRRPACRHVLDRRNESRLSCSKPQKELYDGQKIRNFTAEVAQRMSTLPGVNFAGLAEEGPYGSRGAMHVTVGASDGRTARSDMDIVSPGLFATLGIPLLNGRDFSVRDGEHAKRVGVVDEVLAGRLFGNADAVGKVVEASVGEG